MTRTLPGDVAAAAFADLPLADRYRAIRAFSEHLCAPLATEDYVVQSMTDVSPTKWHLAHTTWFWETFVLVPYLDGYTLHHPDYPFLFNSYYVQAGPRHCRAQRGYLSRPTVAEVYAYRAYVDDHMQRLLDGLDEEAHRTLAETVEIGLHHEQQHQELMLTDIKHVFSVNPLRPAYNTALIAPPAHDPGPTLFVPFDEGVYEVGFRAPSDATVGRRFHYDNEGPAHRVFLEPFALAHRLVTNGDYLTFIEDGGYTTPSLWLSEGWATVAAQGWKAPFYWEERDGAWHHFTLRGLEALDPHLPVCHLSFFEAEAFARWAGGRLPTEFEWEVASQSVPLAGSFVEAGYGHPAGLSGSVYGDGQPALQQLYGEVWQWTRSDYGPYPGYRPVPGALGEYNGKFMSNQYVLRGGSCATSRTHLRRTYRNFFPADSTWQFMGLRLAQ